MPGTPPTSPNFGAPRFSDQDPPQFAEQLNQVTDTFDAKAAQNDKAASFSSLTVSGETALAAATGVTPPTGDNSENLATTEFVQTAVEISDTGWVNATIQGGGSLPAGWSAKLRVINGNVAYGILSATPGEQSVQPGVTVSGTGIGFELPFVPTWASISADIDSVNGVASATLKTYLASVAVRLLPLSSSPVIEPMLVITNPTAAAVEAPTGGTFYFEARA